jgi:hypothetical protein
LLGGLTIALAGLALLSGPGGARAQSWPGYGYPQGYAAGYQQRPMAYYNTGYPQGGSAGYTPYYQGYNRNYYNYNNNYPYYYNTYPQYYTGQAAQGMPAGQATTAAPAEGGGDAKAPAAGGDGKAPAVSSTDATPPAACDTTQLFQPVLPVVPLNADEVPNGHGGKSGPAHHDRIWAFAGYDLSYIKNMPITTPLATTGSLADAHPGALGQPGTAILFGNSASFQEFNGARVGAGVYLDDCGQLSVDFLGRYLIPDHVRYAATSDATGSPLIARPIFNAVDQNERAFADSFPGSLVGGISIDIRSEFWGAELNTRYQLRPNDNIRLDILAGFRFLRLQENLTVRDELTPLTSPGAVTFLLNPVNAGDVVTDVDSFKTVNHFYGFQLGGQVSWEGKYLFVGAFGKAALGITDEEVDINGSTALFTGGQAFSASGGVLALPTNIGQHNQTVLGFVPEGGVTFGVKIKPCLRLTASYSFLYWNSVVRPGNQIDRVINPTMVPTDISFGTLAGPARPAFRFSEENFWVHTLTVGLDFRY